MHMDANSADLVLVLGTSLGGLNADRVATQAADRSLKGKAMGAVCINLQQTPEDGKMALRIFGTSDNVLCQLCKCLKDDIASSLGLQDGQRLSLRPPDWTSAVKVLVPYDSEGHPVAQSAPWMWLDLRDGAKVKITDANNLEGCKQPSCKHLGARKLIYNVERKDVVFSPGQLGIDIENNGLVSAVRQGLAKDEGVEVDWIMRKVIQGGVSKYFHRGRLRHYTQGSEEYTAVFDVPRRPAPPTGTVSKRDQEACCFDLLIGGSAFHLGIWWLEAAARGALKILPVVNVNPEIAPAATYRVPPATSPSRARLVCDSFQA